MKNNITAFLLPRLGALLMHTIRIKWIGTKLPLRAVVMFWHGKMFAGWWLARMEKPVAMVSKSKDGDLLASVLEYWGYSLARGSSSRDGIEALEVAMQSVREERANRLVITPDGPRGPRHAFKRGAFLAAANLGVPLYMLDINYSHPLRLKSWDKFEVPLPFSKITVSTIPIDMSGFPPTPHEQYEWIAAHTVQFEEWQSTPNAHPAEVAP